MDLTPHEEKILAIIKKHPKVISDPEIRRRVANGASIRYLVPRGVERFIIDNRLYGKEGGHEQ